MPCEQKNKMKERHDFPDSGKSKKMTSKWCFSWWFLVPFYLCEWNMFDLHLLIGLIKSS